MGIVEKKVKVEPLPITVKMTPIFPIAFERIPILVEVVVWNRTDKAYRDSYLDIGFKPIERPGSIIPVKTVKLGSISPQSKVKKKLWIRCLYAGKFIPVIILYLVEKRLMRRIEGFHGLPDVMEKRMFTMRNQPWL